MDGPSRRTIIRRALKAAAAVVLASMFILSPAPAQETAGPVVKLSYRVLQPGEPILVTLESDRTVKAASVTFQGRAVVLEPGPEDGRAFAFLGIDLAAKPGSHVMEIRIDRKSGETERIRKDIEIADKDFPSTSLRFRPEYVTPPAEVQERIRRERDIVAWVMSVVTPEWLGDGEFIWPHAAPHWSNFGQRRLYNEVLQSVHTGLDIRVPFGDPIRAANAGRVVLASHLYFGGKTVIIDHGLGVFSSYGHLSELSVKRGEAVKKGQVVGLCGSTGRSTGPHLHWAVKIFASRVDPEAMLRLPL